MFTERIDKLLLENEKAADREKNNNLELQRVNDRFVRLEKVKIYVHENFENHE